MNGSDLTPSPLDPSTPTTPPSASRPAAITSQAAGGAAEEEDSADLHDLATRVELEHLLRDFYGRALVDPLLREVFVDVAHLDLDVHLPKITDFWQKVLFGTGSYDGRVLEVHRRLHQHIPLTVAHFDRWLELWRAAVAQRYAGPVAEQACAHAERMAAVFLRNLTEPRRPGRPLPLVARSSNTT